MESKKGTKANGVIYTRWYIDKYLITISFAVIIVVGFMMITLEMEMAGAIYWLFNLSIGLFWMSICFVRLIFDHANIKIQNGLMIRTAPISNLIQVEHTYIPILGPHLLIYHRKGKKIKRLACKYGYTEEVFSIIRKNYPHVLTVN